jgi:hypothetical protein
MASGIYSCPAGYIRDFLAILPLIAFGFTYFDGRHSIISL